MFGYIKIDKDELKVRDYNLFKAYYCGVCQTLKKEYGFPARYFLSYDVTFLAILLASVEKGNPVTCPIRCLSNPAIKRPAVTFSPILEYVAAVNVLLVWFKLKDDWADNHSLKALFLMPFMYRKRNKARNQFSELYHDIEHSLHELSNLEKEQCAQSDAVAAAFGQVMSSIFTTSLVADHEKRRIFSHMGFLLGRLIYLLDAWADQEEDKKKKSYNPFLLTEVTKEDMLHSFHYTLGELGKTFDLLSPYKNQTIIENIIYLGLKKAVDSVFQGKETKSKKEKHHERPI